MTMLIYPNNNSSHHQRRLSTIVNIPNKTTPTTTKRKEQETIKKKKKQTTNTVTILCLYCLLVTTCLGIGIGYLFLSNNNSSSSLNPPPPLPPRKIFVDLGANCGNTYLKHKQEQFDKEDSDTSNTTTTNNNNNWEIYLWEPSPQMHQFFLNDLQKTNPNIHILPYAAGTINTTMKLYIHKGQENILKKHQFRDKGKCDPNSAYNPSGGSTLYSNAKVAGKAVDVQVVDFPSWLQSLNIRNGIDTFVFKVDIEGAELSIFEKLLSKKYKDDTVCSTEVIEMEFHKNIFQEGTDDYTKHEQFEKNFRSMFEQKCGRKVNLKLLS